MFLFIIWSETGARWDLGRIIVQWFVNRSLSEYIYPVGLFSMVLWDYKPLANGLQVNPHHGKENQEVWWFISDPVMDCCFLVERGLWVYLNYCVIFSYLFEFLNLLLFFLTRWNIFWFSRVYSIVKFLQKEN
jgi:hypothetical protein